MKRTTHQPWVLVFTAVLVVFLLAEPLFAAAQDPPPAGAPAQEGPAGRGPQQPRIRPYDQVITKDAKSDEGVFAVHRIRDRVY